MCTAEPRPPSVPTEPQASGKADAIAFYSRVKAEAKACDTAFAMLRKAADGSDPVSAYGVAEIAETQCLKADFDKVEIPVSVGQENYDRLNKGLELCRNSKNSQWLAAKSAKAALDGDQKPSTMLNIRRGMSQSGTFSCFGKVAAVAIRLGASSNELGLQGDTH